MTAPELRPLNVLLLPRWYPSRLDPQMGVFIQKHARAIASLHHVKVFHALPDESMSSPAIEREIRKSDGLTEHLYYFKKDRSVFGRFFNGLNYYRCWRAFRKDVGLFRADGYRPDLVHAYIILRTALLAGWTAKRHKVPYLLSEQWSGYVSGEFGTLGRVRRQLIRWSVKHASGVSAVSNFLKTNMEHLFGRTDIRVIYNIIEPDVPTPTLRTSDTVRIAMVADLVDATKNISGVIRAIKSLTATVPGLRLTIIGGGPDQQRLQELVRTSGLGESIVFLGRKSNEEVYRLLVDSDFLVMNSRFETFSLICAEALRCGKPVVATRCGGPEEIIHSGNGILIPIDDDPALLDALQRMCRDAASYDPETLMREATSKFGMHSAAAGFDRWYRETTVIGPSKLTVGGL